MAQEVHPSIVEYLARVGNMQILEKKLFYLDSDESA